MSDIVTDLAALLGQVRRPGDFYTSGTTELLSPALSVDGVGPIALPLLPAQAAQLVAAAEQAPYGRGPDTIVDTSVRNTWQIEPGNMHIGGRHWPRTLQAILALAGEGLGVGDPIEAEFYKLLIYERGSFFVPHRDTEKSPGMFATLVIVLPSPSAGGELVVRHKDRAVQLDLRSEDPSEVAFAAFYADCLHEVLPVTEGCRLTLVYNLIRRGKGRAPEPPNYTKEQDQLAALLRDWRDSMDADAKEAEAEDADTDAENEDEYGEDAGAGDAGVPQKLVYPLEHAYTAPELGFSSLKGADAAAAALLAAAAKQADCALHLALVEVMESGSATENFNYRRRRRRYDDEDDDADDGEFEVDEIGESYTVLSDWRAYDGTPVSWGEIPVRDKELSPPDPFHALKPDELHFEEASGNAGVTFERRYRRAALVVWPNDRTLAVLTQAGLPVTVPHLSDLAERWAAAGAETGSPTWQEAHELAGHMIDAWPEHAGRPTAEAADSFATGLLRALIRLRDTARIDAFLRRVTAAAGALIRADNPAIVAALHLFPAREAADLLERIVTGNSTKRFAACADLLARAAAGLPALRSAGLADAAAMLIATLPIARPAHDWRGGTDAIDAGFVADLLTALGAISTDLAAQAVTHILAHPKPYDPDATLVPAVRDRLSTADAAMQPAVIQLRRACLAHLDARIAEPLAPPSDWTRPNTVECRCRHCSELGLFLANAKQKVWVFRAVAADRGHVEGMIRTARCDVDTRTETHGRPYSLICTKNQASYERRVEQRRQDLADAERLRAA